MTDFGALGRCDAEDDIAQSWAILWSVGRCSSDSVVP